MSFSWFSHEFLMSFSWVSLDFLMTLMNFSWLSQDFSWLSELAMVCAVSALVIYNPVWYRKEEQYIPHHTLWNCLGNKVQENSVRQIRRDIQREIERESGRKDRRESGKAFGRDIQTKPLPLQNALFEPVYLVVVVFLK